MSIALAILGTFGALYVARSHVDLLQKGGRNNSYDLKRKFA